MAAMVRLNKYLANCGVGARRKCDDLIASGLVSVNGAVQSELGSKVAVGVDRVTLRDALVEPVTRFQYLVLNKPRGVITTARDERGRPSVLDLVQSNERLYPVGRLDRDTSGLLLLTNDGDFAYRLTHPKYEVKKTYEVQLNKVLQQDDKSRLEKGVRLEEGVTSRAVVSCPGFKAGSTVRITIHQGWNRQIRRMFEALGYRVAKLKRVRFGDLTVAGLRPGEWRKLRKSEIEQLKAGHGN